MTQRFIDLTRNEQGLIIPFNENKTPIFSHCCGGSSAITYGYFQDECHEVFRLHGFEVIIDGIEQ